MGRRQARVAAMQMVYENMLGGEGGEDTLRGLIAFEPDEADQAYIDMLLNGIRENEARIDETIASYLKDWTIDRIARVVLAILRVAVYELEYHPEGVNDADAVNEAVTMAQRFDSPESGRFVNGLLRTLLRNREEKPI